MKLIHRFEQLNSWRPGIASVQRRTLNVSTCFDHNFLKSTNFSASRPSWNAEWRDLALGAKSNFQSANFHAEISRNFMTSSAQARSTCSRASFRFSRRIHSDNPIISNNAENGWVQLVVKISVDTSEHESPKVRMPIWFHSSHHLPAIRACSQSHR